jgi:AcrR family transcriptional regulator
MCAIADSVAADGYAATSVADIIALADVSRRTFCEHFEDKEACFLAAYDSGVEAISEATLNAIDGLESWEEILDSVLSTWLEFLQADLALTRADMIEFWAVGDSARERWKNGAIGPPTCSKHSTKRSRERPHGGARILAPMCRRVREFRIGSDGFASLKPARRSSTQLSAPNPSARRSSPPA